MKILENTLQCELEKIQNYILAVANDGMRMEQLGVMVHNKFESFDWKMYFPSTWLEFVLLCPDLMVYKKPGSHKRFVGIKDKVKSSMAIIPKFAVSILDDELRKEWHAVQGLMVNKVQNTGVKGVTLGQLESYIRQTFKKENKKKFDHTKYIPSSWSDFVLLCPGLTACSKPNGEYIKVNMSRDNGIDAKDDQDEVRQIKANNMNLIIHKLQKLERELMVIRSKEEQLVIDNDRLRGEIMEYMQLYKNEHEQSKQANQKCHSLEIANKTLRKEMDIFRYTISNQQEDIERMRRYQQDLECANDALIKETNEMHDKLDELKDYTQNINVLNVEQLDKLKQRFESKLAKIDRAKEKIFEDKLLCMICMDNRKNVVIQGCNHYVMCDKCERHLNTKKCPQCQQPYLNVLKLSI